MGWNRGLSYKVERELLLGCNNRECISYSSTSTFHCASKCAKALIKCCPLYRPARGVVYKLQNLSTGLFYDADMGDNDLGSCFRSGWEAVKAAIVSLDDVDNYELVEYFLIENSRNEVESAKAFD